MSFDESGFDSSIQSLTTPLNLPVMEIPRSFIDGRAAPLLASRATRLRTCTDSVLVRARRFDLFHDIAHGETRRLGARRKLLEAFEHLRDDRLRGDLDEHAVALPIRVVDARRRPLEWIGTQVVQVRHAQRRKLALPDAERKLGAYLGVLLQKADLPVTNSERHQVAVIAPVEEAFAGRLLLLA